MISTHYFSNCPMFISIKSLLCLQIITTSWNSNFNRQSIKYSVISHYHYWQLAFPIDSKYVVCSMSYVVCRILISHYSYILLITQMYFCSETTQHLQQNANVLCTIIFLTLIQLELYYIINCIGNSNQSSASRTYKYF